MLKKGKVKIDVKVLAAGRSLRSKLLRSDSRYSRVVLRLTPIFSPLSLRSKGRRGLKRSSSSYGTLAYSPVVKGCGYRHRFAALALLAHSRGLHRRQGRSCVPAAVVTLPPRVHSRPV